MPNPEANSEPEARSAEALVALVRMLARQAARDSHSDLAQRGGSPDAPASMAGTEPLDG